MINFFILLGQYIKKKTCHNVCVTNEKTMLQLERPNKRTIYSLADIQNTIFCFGITEKPRIKWKTKILKLAEQVMDCLTR